MPADTARCQKRCTHYVPSMKLNPPTLAHLKRQHRIQELGFICQSPTCGRTGLRKIADFKHTLTIEALEARGRCRDCGSDIRIFSRWPTSDYGRPI